jgi:hypothetical protein
MVAPWYFATIVNARVNKVHLREADHATRLKIDSPEPDKTFTLEPGAGDIVRRIFVKYVGGSVFHLSSCVFHLKWWIKLSLPCVGALTGSRKGFSRV